MKKWHAEYSGWNDIKDIINKYNGDYTQARLYGNLDYYLNQYKMKINNPNADPTQGNPILLRAQQNKANLTSFITASGDDEHKSRIMPGDIRRYNEFKDGEIENFEFAGLRGDYNIQGLIDQTDLGKEINMDDIIANNYHAIVTDMHRDTGLSLEEIQGNPEAIKTWVQSALNWDPQKPLHGTAEIETSYSLQFKKNLDALPALLMGVSGDGKTPKPLTVSKLFDLEKDGISFQNILEATNPDGIAYSDLWESLGGYNPNQKPYDKWTTGTQLISSGQILTDPKLQLGVLKSMYGANYNGEKGMVYDIQMNGLYTEGGTLITDDDIAGSWWERGIHGGATTGAITATGTAIFNAAPGVGTVAWGATTAIGTGVGFVSGALGWNPYAENETDDLYYSGTFLAFRLTGLDGMTGEKTSALITRGMNEDDIPDCIRMETEAYKNQNDMIGTWITENLTPCDNILTPFNELFSDFETWKDDNCSNYKVDKIQIKKRLIEWQTASKYTYSKEVNGKNNLKINLKIIQE